MIVEPRPVAIIASREDVTTLATCIEAAIHACRNGTTVIDVLVNGNPKLAEALARIPLAAPQTCTLRIWNILQGDKAHAWNEYVHRIWPGKGNAIFLDGYVEVDPDAFEALDRALAASPAAKGATGVPNSGRSAASLRAHMLREGGFHGNLNAICGDAIYAMRASGIRLPLGLYRTDSLTGALLMLGLDPASNTWDRQRIAVVPDAAWKVRSLGRITYKAVVTQLKRILRQAQGELENRAAREHLVVKRLAPIQLPPTSQALIWGWLAAQPVQARRLFFKRPLCAYAAWRVRAPRDWSAAAVAPMLIVGSDCPTGTAQ